MIVARALSTSPFAPGDDFLPRHMGSQGATKQMMLDYIGFSSLEELTESTVPSQIRMEGRLDLDPPQTESEAINKLKTMLSKNKVYKSFIGAGYYETITPPVILRNVRILRFINIFLLP